MPKSYQETPLSEKQKQKLRTFTTEFKQNAVDLIAKQGYSFNGASESLGVDATTLRSWHRKLTTPPAPLAEDATVAELKAENSRLRRELQRVEMEREILKRVAPRSLGKGDDHALMI